MWALIVGLVHIFVLLKRGPCILEVLDVNRTGLGKDGLLDDGDLDDGVFFDRLATSGASAPSSISYAPRSPRLSSGSCMIRLLFVWRDFQTRADTVVFSISTDRERESWVTTGLSPPNGVLCRFLCPSCRCGLIPIRLSLRREDGLGFEEIRAQHFFLGLICVRFPCRVQDRF